LPTTSGQIEAVVDESGRSIFGMLQKAADMAKEDSLALRWPDDSDGAQG
jgi:hypothetical protein